MRRGLTYAELAEKVGLSRSGLYKIVEGHREPDFDKIDQIATALGISAIELFKAPTSAEGQAVSKNVQVLDSMTPLQLEAVMLISQIDEPTIKNIIGLVLRPQVDRLASLQKSKRGPSGAG